MFANFRELKTIWSNASRIRALQHEPCAGVVMLVHGHVCGFGDFSTALSTGPSSGEVDLPVLLAASGSGKSTLMGRCNMARL